MKELKMIENELVPVYATDTGEKVVYGTELHEVLEVKSNYREWVRRRFNDIDAIESEDFEGVENSTPSGQTRTDHIIKLDTAKEMAMLERNEKGKQVRRYFIEIENKYKEQQPPLSEIDLFERSLNAIKENRNRIEEVNADLQEFKQEMPILGVEEVKITNAVKKKGVQCLGGKSAPAYGDGSLRAKLYADIYLQLKREFGVTSYKAIPRGQCDKAVEIIERYTMPYVIEEAVMSMNGQIAI